ncbi:type VI secretion system domain-containing protein [Salmonella enterica subsp. enterica]|nr:type VI secretion system domain-containing protein [Salmonella enterica subsp. enterica]
MEKSLLLAPYWLDGRTFRRRPHNAGLHQRGRSHPGWRWFTAFSPACRNLPMFNDRTPFISEQTKQWLAASPGSQTKADGPRTSEDTGRIPPVFQRAERGWRPRCDTGNPCRKAIRAVGFHRRYLGAQLVRRSRKDGATGCFAECRMLFEAGLRMTLAG